MASNRVEDICCCEICVNDFGSGENCPRILYCGHTFCQRCLNKILDDDNCMCPTCKKVFTFKSVNDIPINYGLMDISKGLKDNKLQKIVNKKVSSRFDALPFESYCKEHDLPNHFKCINCSSFICGTCGILAHKNCEKLQVNKALNILKKFDLQKIIIIKNQLSIDTEILDAEYTELINNMNIYENMASDIRRITEIKEKKDKFLSNLILQERIFQELNCNKEFEEARSSVISLFQENDLSYEHLLMSREVASKLSTEDFESGNIYITKMGGGNRMFSKVTINDQNIITFNQWINTLGKWLQKYKIIDILDFIDGRYVEKQNQKRNVENELEDSVLRSSINYTDEKIFLSGGFYYNGDDMIGVLNLQNLLTRMGCNCFCQHGERISVFYKEKTVKVKKLVIYNVDIIDRLKHLLESCNLTELDSDSLFED